MVSIIRGKRYSTATASRIGTAAEPVPSDNPGWWQSTLFKTVNGAFFLLNEGNHLSPFAAEVNGHLEPGAKIVPLSDDEARGWAEDQSTSGRSPPLWASSTPDALGAGLPPAPEPSNLRRLIR